MEQERKRTTRQHRCARKRQKIPFLGTWWPCSNCGNERNRPRARRCEVCRFKRSNGSNGSNARESSGAAATTTEPCHADVAGSENRDTVSDMNHGHANQTSVPNLRPDSEERADSCTGSSSGRTRTIGVRSGQRHICGAVAKPATECPVCYKVLANGEALVLLPCCSHGICNLCIWRIVEAGHSRDTRVSRRSRMFDCPFCRRRVSVPMI